MRKLGIYFLVCCLCLITCTSAIFAEDYDFENNESTYYALCSQTGMTDEDKTVCKLFQTYLSEKANNIQQEITAANKELESIKSDLNAVLSKISELDKKIEEIEKQQEELELQILTIEANIAELEVEIEERTLRIEEIDEQLRLRMYNMQSIISLNKYIEYLMGATDFADLIRRTSALNQLMDYDSNQMQLLEDEKVQLEADIEDMEEQKASLEGQKELYETTKKTVEEARATQLAYRAEYLKKQAELEAAVRGTKEELSSIQSAINDIADKINYVPPSAGWIYPIKESFYISAGAWYYPKSFGGGMHLGVDFAASTSKHVVAPANGIVAYTYDRCTTGGLNNTCGIPKYGGNQALLIVQVGDNTYGILLCHMSKGLNVKAGDYVSQGDIIGNVGSTGSSTGPHLHIEVYDLGTMSIQTAWNKFKSTGNVTFGTGWYTLSTTCDNKAAPCRMNPQKVFNVKVGYTYNQ